MLNTEPFTTRPDFERERATMGAAAALGFAVSGFLGVAAVALPVPDSMDVRGLAMISLAGLAVAPVIFLFRDRIPLWAFHVLTVVGIVMVTVSIWVNGDPAATNELFYLYIAGFAFYYYSSMEAAGYSLLMLVAYGWIEAEVNDGRIEPTSLLIFAGAMVMLGGMLRFVGGRSRALHDKLQGLATTDELTGLLNRRGLQEKVVAERMRSERSGLTFSLLIGDLDHFKAVNDRLGHMGGDMALERTAAALGTEQRATDSIARIGGEEFAVLMPQTHKDDAIIAAERFRLTLKKAFEGRPVELTISIGVASYPADGESWEQLLDAADKALYAAKEAGRDRVIAFDRTAPVVPG